MRGDMEKNGVLGVGKSRDEAEDVPDLDSSHSTDTKGTEVSLGQPAVDDVRRADVNTLQNCDNEGVGAQPEAQMPDAPREEGEREGEIRRGNESGDSRLSLAWSADASERVASTRAANRRAQAAATRQA